MKKTILIHILSFCTITLLGQERFSIQLRSGEDLNTKVVNNRYLFPEFTAGTVVFAESATKVPMNYDMIMDEMHYTDARGQVKALTNNPAEIVSIIIGEREFVHLQYGYAEVLAYFDNKALLIRRKIKTETEKPTGAYGTVSDISAVERSTAILGAAITGGENFTELSGARNITFNVTQTIYLQSGKSTYTGGSESNFLKVFGNNKKSMIRDYVKNRNLDLKKPTDLVELFNYLVDNI